ncbi:hypothetical protein Agub_g12277, partial [Astrephomene gubernaculifera]
MFSCLRIPCCDRAAPGVLYADGASKESRQTPSPTNANGASSGSASAAVAVASGMFASRSTPKSTSALAADKHGLVAEPACQRAGSVASPFSTSQRLEDAAPGTPGSARATTAASPCTAGGKGFHKDSAGTSNAAPANPSSSVSLPSQRHCRPGHSGGTPTLSSGHVTGGTHHTLSSSTSMGGGTATLSLAGLPTSCAGGQGLVSSLLRSEAGTEVTARLPGDLSTAVPPPLLLASDASTSRLLECLTADSVDNGGSSVAGRLPAGASVDHGALPTIGAAGGGRAVPQRSPAAAGQGFSIFGALQAFVEQSNAVFPAAGSVARGCSAGSAGMHPQRHASTATSHEHFRGFNPALSTGTSHDAPTASLYRRHAGPSSRGGGGAGAPADTTTGSPSAQAVLGSNTLLNTTAGSDALQAAGLIIGGMQLESTHSSAHYRLAQMGAAKAPAAAAERVTLADEDDGVSLGQQLPGLHSLDGATSFLSGPSNLHSFDELYGRHHHPGGGQSGFFACNASNDADGKSRHDNVLPSAGWYGAAGAAGEQAGGGQRGWRMQRTAERREFLSAARCISSVLGDVQIVSVLGAGAHGRVYKGLLRDRLVAVKVIIHEADTAPFVAGSIGSGIARPAPSNSQLGRVSGGGGGGGPSGSLPGSSSLPSGAAGLPAACCAESTPFAASTRQSASDSAGTAGADAAAGGGVGGVCPPPHSSCGKLSRSDSSSRPAMHSLHFQRAGSSNLHALPMSAGALHAAGGSALPLLSLPGLAPVVMPHKHMLEGLISASAHHPNIVETYRIVTQLTSAPAMPAFVVTRGSQTPLWDTANLPAAALLGISKADRSSGGGAGPPVLAAFGGAGSVHAGSGGGVGVGGPSFGSSGTPGRPQRLQRASSLGPHRDQGARPPPLASPLGLAGRSTAAEARQRSRGRSTGGEGSEGPPDLGASPGSEGAEGRQAAEAASPARSPCGDAAAAGARPADAGVRLLGAAAAAGGPSEGHPFSAVWQQHAGASGAWVNASSATSGVRMSHAGPCTRGPHAHAAYLPGGPEAGVAGLVGRPGPQLGMLAEEDAEGQLSSGCHILAASDSTPCMVDKQLGSSNAATHNNMGPRNDSTADSVLTGFLGSNAGSATAGSMAGGGLALPLRDNSTVSVSGLVRGMGSSGRGSADRSARGSLVATAAEEAAMPGAPVLLAPATGSGHRNSNSLSLRAAEGQEPHAPTAGRASSPQPLAGVLAPGRRLAEADATHNDTAFNAVGCAAEVITTFSGGNSSGGATAGCSPSPKGLRKAAAAPAAGLVAQAARSSLGGASASAGEQDSAELILDLLGAQAAAQRSHSFLQRQRLAQQQQQQGAMQRAGQLPAASRGAVGRGGSEELDAAPQTSPGGPSAAASPLAVGLAEASATRDAAAAGGEGHNAGSALSSIPLASLEAPLGDTSPPFDYMLPDEYGATSVNAYNFGLSTALFSSYRTSHEPAEYGSFSGAQPGGPFAAARASPLQPPPPPPPPLSGSSPHSGDTAGGPPSSSGGGTGAKRRAEPSSSAPHRTLTQSSSQHADSSTSSLSIPGVEASLALPPPLLSSPPLLDSLSAIPALVLSSPGGNANGSMSVWLPTIDELTAGVSGAPPSLGAAAPSTTARSSAGSTARPSLVRTISAGSGDQQQHSGGGACTAGGGGGGGHASGSVASLPSAKQASLHGSNYGGQLMPAEVAYDKLSWSNHTATSASTNAMLNSGFTVLLASITT